MLVILCGLPGTGKTFVAMKLKQKLGAARVNIDCVRREQLGDKKYFEYADKYFSTKERNAAHAKLLELTRDFLLKNKFVILESGFSTKKRRKAAINCAIDANHEYKLIKITCPETIVLERLKRRLKEKTSSSTAGCKVYALAKRKFEPIGVKHFTIDASDAVETQINEIFK